MWKVEKVEDNEFPVIMLDNGRSVMVKIYYGKYASSNGMSTYEYRAYLEMFAMAKVALESSTHSDFMTRSGKTVRCDCPWCHRAYTLLDGIKIIKKPSNIL